jgi:hypothetical protein
MSNPPRYLGARVLLSCWVIAIIVGFLASLDMAFLAFRHGTMTSALVFSAIAIGCAGLGYRTYAAREMLRSYFE